MPDAVVIQGLTKRYGELVAVDALDLRIPTGVCFGLLGPNGAGKTTTIRILQGQLPVSSGSVRVLGLDMATSARAAKARLGIVPQETNLDPDFTVRHNLLVYARYFRIARKAAAAKADELLKFLQLEEKSDSGILELSGGMKRRLIVARALVNDPELIVLDEPTTGLDPQARHTIWDKIRQLRAQGKTILLTTHYMDEAERLCDELVVIDHGKILSRGTPRDLIQKHTQGEAVELVLGHEADDQVAALARHLKDAGIPHETLSDRVIAFGAGLDEVAQRAAAAFPVRETVRRRATLEDVFLRLTGRALRD
ncbi:MAG: ATP-binding cassette domain-containing protein [Candidatus Thermoplasmatota archaeon]